ncbi:hypothetical protein GGR03_000239 [Aurantimonas endophytica]|uniref:Uncharacterized protein n=1 Tax=Aurantimonas endophytica TaxID=1522175 RepID=A0A7W6H9X7_9HYPH|nr:hypothetical protein [Aurantimonas endophytica]
MMHQLNTIASRRLRGLLVRDVTHLSPVAGGRLRPPVEGGRAPCEPGR